MLMTGIASAQINYSVPNHSQTQNANVTPTGTSTTHAPNLPNTGVSGTSTSPHIPNTGAGGNAESNAFALAAAGAIAAIGMYAFARKQVR